MNITEQVADDRHKPCFGCYYREYHAMECPREEKHPFRLKCIVATKRRALQMNFTQFGRPDQTAGT